jgi:hypothetical protein
MFLSFKKVACLTLLVSPLLMGSADHVFANDANAEALVTKVKVKRELKSLMFSSSDIFSLEKVLEAKERYDGDPMGLLGAGGFGESDILQEIRRRAILEQEQALAGAALPDLYVSSIVYRSANDWTVWVRKESYTPIDLNQILDIDKGETDGNGVASLTTDEPELISAGSEVFVLSASRPIADVGRMKITLVENDRVRLKYTPTASASALKKFQNKDVLTPRAQKYVNRISRDSFSYAPERNEFTTDMRVNQTFSLNMMRVVEGRTLAKKRPKAAIATNNAAQAVDEIVPQGDGILKTSDSLEARAANQLIGDMKKIPRLLPVKTTE